MGRGCDYASALIVALTHPSAWRDCLIIRRRASQSCVSQAQHGQTRLLCFVDLVVNFKEAGLESGSVETLRLDANGTATYQCFNNGGRHPRAANKETVSDDLTASQNFPVDQNGNLVGTISLAPPGPGSFTCPSGQTMVGPTNVSYTNIVLSDITSGATISLGSAS